MKRLSTTLAAMLLCGTAAAAPATDRYVVLVTLDGVRIQELFGGMDPVLANAPESESGIYEIDVMKARYWRDTPVARREALMPFFWKTLAPAGVVFGNPAKGSRVTVQNRQWFSYPGYSELLTGRPQPDVTSNELVRYPRNRTVLEHLHDELGLGFAEIAQIGSWDGLKYAAASRDGAFLMNGARDPLPADLSTPDIDRYVELRGQIQQLWEETSNDVLTFRIAKEYLLKNRPRLLWLGLGQSDDWAHARRYDLVLDFLHQADTMLADLWQTLQSTEPYRGRTTLIVTTDHGRGRTPADWAEHDFGIEGSQDIFIAVIGPDTPATGEAEDVADVHQGDIAATILQHLGLDWRDFHPDARPPVPSVRAAP